ncbi:MAG TPA: hypothetical protein VLL76_04055 [Candidatus Omnitrophota bacterium]|nr:hypothetical protein [Candidatus Omnitrophota bacterium]
MIGLDVKRMFFDRQAVIVQADAATRKVLSKFGAFVRRTARGSIRRRKKTSEPGAPPSGHTGLLKRLIFFAYDPDRRSVVIGPAPLRAKVEAPPLLEYGGTARRKDRRGRTVTARYRARPFMGPALAKELPGLPPLWRESI